MNATKLFKEVCLIDSFSPASHHEQYNAAMALMLASIFERVVYWVGDGQKESITSKLEEFGGVPGNIEWRRLKPYVSGMIDYQKDYHKQHLVSLRLNMSMLFKSKRDALLIFNYNNPLALFPLKFINIFKRRKIVFINHGELEYMTDDREIPYARTTRLIGKWHKAAMRFRRRNKNIFYLVIGESIKNNLVALDCVDPDRTPTCSNRSNASNRDPYATSA